jgi:DNA-binding CsgD family transcriptional regulator
MKRRALDPQSGMKAPTGLTGVSVRAGRETYVVLSFPIQPTPELPTALTRAERAVVELVLEGKRAPEIARVRDVSLRTVANQLQSAYRKLGVSSRGELARLLRKPHS